MSAQRGKLGYRITGNPFHVLGLSPDCSRAEIEREGQKLLGMLELGLSAARTYHTPLGKFERTTESVREAMAELRDPDRRLGHELWARSRAGDPGSGREAATHRRGAAAEAAGAPDRAGRGAADRGAEHDGPESAHEASEPAPWSDAFAILGWRRR